MPRHPKTTLPPRTATLMALGWWLAVRGREIRPKELGRFGSDLWAFLGEPVKPATIERQFYEIRKTGLLGPWDERRALGSREKVYSPENANAALLGAFLLEAWK